MPRSRRSTPHRLHFHISSLHEARHTSEHLARKALSLDPSDAFAHARLAAAIFAAGDLEGCILKCDEALSLDTNCAVAHGVKGGAWCSPDDERKGKYLFEYASD